MPETIRRRDFIKSAAILGTALYFGCSVDNKFDLIILNGNIYDGSGGKGFKADIGIKNNSITAIGNLKDASANKMIEATNKIVCPGFIDIHTHTDVELLVNPKAESKIRQGVTTEVSGQCGSSPFPLLPEDAAGRNEAYKNRYDIDVYWETTEEFLDTIKSAGPSINYATFTGHGDLRAYVLGRNDVQPDKEQLKQMQKLLDKTLDSGSIGLSTGLEYAPGSYGKTEELIELCKIVTSHNKVYATHMRNEDDTLLEAIEEAITIAEGSGVSLQISHLKACNRNNWHKIESALSLIDKKYSDGMNIHADRYPYTAYGTGLSALLPLWSRQGTNEEIIARLNDKSTFNKIADHIESRGKRIGGWDRFVISYCNNDKCKHAEGINIIEGAAKENLTPVEYIRDLLIQNELSTGMVGFAMDEENTKKVLAHPRVFIGSDGNAVAPYGKLGTGKPHPRYYGSFPRVIGKYVREEGIMDLSTAISKMTNKPAQKLGLKKRGILKEGNFADIVIFSADKIIDKATFTDPHQYPEGINYVVVNGKVVINNGQHTGVDAGKILT